MRSGAWVILVVTVLAGVAWWFWQATQRVECPTSGQILVAVGRDQKATWQPRPGRMYWLLLGTSPSSASADRLAFLSGTIIFRGDCGILYHEHFGPSDLQLANWLDREGRTSVLIGTSPSTLDRALEMSIASGSQLEVELILDEMPQVPVELWASWLTSKAVERQVEVARSDRTQRHERQFSSR